VLADAADASELVGHDPFMLVHGVRSIMWYASSHHVRCILMCCV
jgi:hypothetical protein